MHRIVVEERGADELRDHQAAEGMGHRIALR